MSQAILDPKGLYTHPSTFVSPEGALLVAENIVLDREGTLSSRRGFKKYGTALTLGGENIDKIMTYNGTLIIHYDDKLAYDSNGSGAWVNYSGVFENPDSDARIDSVEANNNFYVSTSEGIQKIDELTGAFTDAGAPPGLLGSYTLAAGTWFPDNSQVAYRFVWGIKDENMNLILGAPSGRLIAINTAGGARQTVLRVYIPNTITTAHFLQVYRSLTTATATTVPNDELGLVYEINPTAGDLVNGYIDVTDITPESLRGAIIYTAQSQEGILQANTEPPFCETLTYYKNSVFFGATRTKQKLEVTLLGTGATGFPVGGTIVIGSFTFTGTLATENTTGSFIVFTAGTPAQNIEDTSQSLIRAIIRRAGNTAFYAYYLSGYNDLPGHILIQEQDVGGSAIAVSSSAGTAWNPTLTTPVNSDNEDKKNRLYYSKTDQPEAVPILNYLNIGAENNPIRKILALRESIIVLKKNEVHRVFGTDPSNFQSTLLDNTISIKGAETAVVFNNRVFCFTNQGVVAITDTGIEIISRPIETDLLTYYSGLFDLEAYAFGVAYESDRKYLLWLPSETTDTSAKLAYVYNAITNSWTKWIETKTSGLVSPDDEKMYLGDSATSYVYQERKNENIFDYADEEIAVNIVSFSGMNVTLTSAASAVIGYGLRQGSLWGKITAINVNVVTVDVSNTWSAGAAFLDVPIRVEIEWKTNFGESYGPIKRFREMKIFTRDVYFNSLTIGFSTDFSPDVDETILTPVDGASWGSLPWGTFPWGSPFIGVQTLRTYFPKTKTRGNSVAINVSMEQPYSAFGITGISIEAYPYDTRQR